MSTTLLSNEQSSADLAGMAASIACAIHCAAMPLVIGYLPMLGLSWLADESFHRVMAAVCFLLALSAFLPGWRRHGSLAPACVGFAGVTLLAVAAFWLECECCPTCVASQGTQLSEATNGCTDEHCPHCPPAASEAATPAASEGAPSQAAAFAWATPFLTPCGGLLLIAGHLVNHRKSCRCRGDSCCLPGEKSDDA